MLNDTACRNGQRSKPLSTAPQAALPVELPIVSGPIGILKLSDLHILLAVAHSGSMAKAANELGVSHPVVSRSISDLEHTLGVRLLDRNPHGVELTEYGRALLNRSHAAFDE